MGFLACEAWLPSGPTSTQDGRDFCAGIEEEAGDVDAVDVGGGDGCGAVGGTEGGEAEAEDDGVVARDADRLGEVVDAGREKQILALGELGVDGGGGVFVGSSNVEVFERNGTAGR